MKNNNTTQIGWIVLSCYLFYQVQIFWKALSAETLNLFFWPTLVCFAITLLAALGVVKNIRVAHTILPVSIILPALIPTGVILWLDGRFPLHLAVVSLVYFMVAIVCRYTLR